MGTLRDNWRVILLVVLLAGSTVALFGSIGGAGDDQGIGNDTAVGASQGPTNLVYGLDLSGGTRIRAPLVGVTAEEVEFGNDSTGQVAQNVAAELQGVDATDVTARQPTQDRAATVEVTTRNVTPDDLGAALDAAGYQHGDVRDGVTEETREQTVAVISNKINQAGLSGGSAQTVSTSTGEYFVLIEVPNEQRADVLELVSQQGQVQVEAYYPVENNSTGDTEYRRQLVLEQGDFQDIGNPEQGQQGQPPNVPVVIRESEAGEFQRTMVETGVASQGGTFCTYDENPNGTQPCLLTVVDGEVVYSAGMSPGLAEDMQSGQWESNPRFILQTSNYSEAQQLAINLRAGALPAPLDIGPGGAGTSSYISPTQGENFRMNSLITGIIAVLAVSGVVFFRYGSARVAAPMVLTALSEVVILLGAAAWLGYPLDLAVIGGFIAVIGTGVDDLIIIADEVMAEGDVKSRKVFQSRFKKAFWVIGAAAATTIIAMSPLAVLSLGDLRGFAIFTILGVLVGVLVTRPAYGDILRTLLTDR
ncbi:preprotein translocase subunit SecD [Haloprofundus marisrubri]|uniref:Protein-export membrane protein SecD n=1 Tax=Haloprofundus marisrubri TaxID=1514971 RepID=A0A0W1R6W0_9EURY|nr:preprotein translocase subunit SecD [Haloprofundus marisrubri]KTG08944.1 preprotein translocase subunit SecD [Haloprofundus marisrubri]